MPEAGSTSEGGRHPIGGTESADRETSALFAGGQSQSAKNEVAPNQKPVKPNNWDGEFFAGRQALTITAPRLTN